ncbi:MAG TPA: tRNA (adenosine(37)-N6)-threonylcarbamoyltransferase complex dimerization subunit type 1 TsaB [Polyangia bacterium]
MASSDSENPPRNAAAHAPFLAFDTSGPTARVAIVDDKGEVLHHAERVSDRHSGTLLPLCHELIGRAGLTVAGLSGVACGSGPGSFTGLRVGLAVAKGLALACDLPLLLVPSLTALAVDLDLARAASSAPDAHDRLLAPCIDAGKGEIYVQLFLRSQSPGAPPAALTPELRTTATAFAEQLKSEARVVLIGGTGADRHLQALQDLLGQEAVLPAFPGPSARAIGHLALERLRRGERDDLDSAVPVYGRPPDITKPKRPPTG